MWIRAAIYVMLSAAAAWVCNRVQLEFRYEDIKDYLTLLSGVSGMVFTIMGIWIAFLYPNALSRLVDQQKVVTVDFTESLSDAKRLERIVAAILISALVMLGALFFTLGKLVFVPMSFYQEHRMIAKSSALGMIVFMTLAQVEAVFSVMFANVMFINDLHWKRQERKANEEL
ncbi:hypothetical protein JI739_24240 [Ramlibacter sp. AW1]|uniref:Uncharacterized protein n=1 Tax=Ramlibacter aurantiacus TaxID=2801330 RepID=A0A936ZVP1_9BURK|nr:hypothetical protein [Ramlibacter aurantiacus]MBL0423461.1 hypothetical protein [Ramlibacter aurantiacus]